jgi:cobalt-zinc-cadmium efflux system membrane fusion protein
MRARWHSGNSWGNKRVAAAVATVVLAIAGGAYFNARADDAGAPGVGAGKVIDPDHVELSDSQAQSIDLITVTERPFPLQSEAVGSIDFNEDLSTQVFTPYQGRIVKLFAKLGDNVSKGQILFTIESPDLIQADSTLIAAAGVLDLTSRALERAQELYKVQGIAEKDLQQAMSDQQTAEGALKAARNAVEVFGKSQAEIDRMVKTRTIDPYLVVASPIPGQVTARNASPGLFVQPGNPPAPYCVADISKVWMNASVTESDMPRVRKGQRVEVSILAFPGQVFSGEISTVGASVDPQLHRGLVRAEVEDPKHELLPGMFASFLINTGDPVTTAGIPLDGIVRQGDGTETVWITSDRRHFTKRTVRLGLQHDGYQQVLDGLRPGEKVVTKGAIYLDTLVGGGLS